MSNFLEGIFVIILCSFGYYFSWKYWKEDNYKIALLLLIVCGFALRTYTATDFFIHTWDENFHALVAKNFIHHPLVPTLYDHPVLPYDYRSWVSNHVWLHKQPFTMWIMALSMWLFGMNEVAMRLPSVVLTTIAIWLTYRIGTFFFNRKTGYLAALFYSFNGLIIEMAGGRAATDHVDIFFLFFIELALFFTVLFARKKKPVYNILVGVSLGLAILSKWLPALIVLPIWLLVVFDSGLFKPKEIIFQFIVLTITFIAIALPWQIYILKTFPLEARWEYGLSLKHFTSVIENQTGPLTYYIDKIRIQFGDLIYLPLLWFFYKTVTDYKNLKRISILIWFLVPLLFFSIAKTKMPAYMLFTAPALFMITAEFFFFLDDYRKNHKQKWLVDIVMLLLIALPIRYTIERVKAFGIRDRNPQWAVEFRKLNELKIKKGVLLNEKRYTEAMFYTNLTVYPNLPPKKTIAKLQKEGYTVIINDNAFVLKEIRNLKGVIYIKLAD